MSTSYPVEPSTTPIDTAPLKNGIFPGRFTGKSDEPFVVFYLGTRLNGIRHLPKFGKVASAMGRMMNVLYSQPDRGFLGGDSYYTLFPVMGVLITYWRSFEHLERFARSKDDPHLPAWREFNQYAGNDGSIGVFHETYLVNPGQYESIYVNMPVMGLAKAAQHVPVGKGAHGSRERLSV